MTIGAADILGAGGLIAQRLDGYEQRDQQIEMAGAVANGVREPLIEADFQFHYAVIRSSGNLLFASIYDTLRSFLHAEIKRSQDDYEDPQQICDEHRQLIAAITTGEQLRAVAVYTGHIENIKRRVKK